MSTTVKQRVAARLGTCVPRFRIATSLHTYANSEAMQTPPYASDGYITDASTIRSLWLKSYSISVMLCLRRRTHLVDPYERMCDEGVGGVSVIQRFYASTRAVQERSCRHFYDRSGRTQCNAPTEITHASSPQNTMTTRQETDCGCLHQALDP